MKTLIDRSLSWLRWLVLPQPWWVVVGVAALIVAVLLCLQGSEWASSFAVVYQVAGAVLAVAQFVSLQRGLNPGWLTAEIRAWWDARPIRRTHRAGASQTVAWSFASSGRISVSPEAGTPHDEQLLLIWAALKTMTTDMDKIDQEAKRQHAHLLKQLESNHAAALEAAEEAKKKVSTALTSAPLMAVIGFWLILLGLGMQVWLAVPAARIG